MNMIKNTIGNEELMDVFEEFDFSSKKDTRNRNSKEYQEMLKLYRLDEVSIPEEGQVVSAKYVGKSSDQFVFSVPGYKDDVRVDDKVAESKYFTNLNMGDIIDVLITNVNHNVFMIKGSVASLYESRAHANLKSLAEGQSVMVTVKSLNPAGYDVELKHGGVTLPGFMPNTLAGINKLHDPNSIVGQTFNVMIESYAQNEGTYIVSRRKYLQTLIPSAIKELEYNKVYSGHVTGTTPFGVFVEFNECLTGMIHKANVNPEWAEKLTSISPGFEIEFYIKEVIKDKIILTQILRETLWDTIKNGQIIEGTVKDVKAFGTLVNLDDETVGLIHTSEMEKVGKKFTADQNIKVKVLSVDRGSRKIFLTVG
jgi:small subunit ribosomal protein S1